MRTSFCRTSFLVEVVGGFIPSYFYAASRPSLVDGVLKSFASSHVHYTFTADIQFTIRTFTPEDQLLII